MVESKFPAAGKSGNKAKAKENQKNLLTWNENLVKVGSRWEKPAKQEMLVGSLEIWDLSCPSLNRYWIHGKTSVSVKLATDKKQSQYIGKKVFPTTTRQDCSLQRCAKMRESGMQNTLPKYGRWNAYQFAYLFRVAETWIACLKICAKDAPDRMQIPCCRENGKQTGQISKMPVKLKGKPAKKITWLLYSTTRLLVS